MAGAREAVYELGDKIELGTRIKWYDSDEGHSLYGDVERVNPKSFIAKCVNNGLSYRIPRASVLATVVFE